MWENEELREDAYYVRSLTMILVIMRTDGLLSLLLALNLGTIVCLSIFRPALDVHTPICQVVKFEVKWDYAIVVM